ncbi:MAG TPA: lipocalin family protein, partial [Hymenobacter sp.]
FTSCKKDKEEPKPKTRTELLTAKNWRISADVTTTVGTSAPDDNYARMPACEKDDFLKFNTNNSCILDAGQLKCNSAEPQTTTGTWNFTDNDTKLTIDGDVYEVVEVSESTLKIKENLSSGRTNITTFTAF